MKTLKKFLFAMIAVFGIAGMLALPVSAEDMPATEEAAEPVMEQVAPPEVSEAQGAVGEAVEAVEEAATAQVLMGEVVSVDEATATLTVKEVGGDLSAADVEEQVKLANETIIEKSGEKIGALDLSAGDKVSVTYHEADGSMVADVVTVE